MHMGDSWNQRTVSTWGTAKTTWLPGIILKGSGPVSYVFKLTDGCMFHRYRDHVRQAQRQTVSLSFQWWGQQLWRWVHKSERLRKRFLGPPERTGTLALTVRPLSHSPYTRSTQNTVTSGAYWVTGGSEKVTAHSQTSRQAECFIEQFRLDWMLKLPCFSGP